MLCGTLLSPGLSTIQIKVLVDMSYSSLSVCVTAILTIRANARVTTWTPKFYSGKRLWPSWRIHLDTWELRNVLGPPSWDIAFLWERQTTASSEFGNLKWWQESGCWHIPTCCQWGHSWTRFGPHLDQSWCHRLDHLTCAAPFVLHSSPLLHCVLSWSGWDIKACSRLERKKTFLPSPYQHFQD